MTRDEILAVVQRRREAVAQRNMDSFGALYAQWADVESPLAGTVHGREAAVHSVSAFFKAFPDAVVREEEPIVDGDHVAIFGEVSGTDVGGIMGLPPSGRSFRFPIAMSFVVHDHLI